MSSFGGIRLEDRVTLDLGFHDVSHIASYVNNAAACAYLPFDEDSYGYVTMEACAASKAVLTTTDAGGVLKLVVDGETGLVKEPEPRALAEGIDELFADPQRTRAMGRARQGQLGVEAGSHGQSPSRSSWHETRMGHALRAPIGDRPLQRLCHPGHDRPWPRGDDHRRRVTAAGRSASVPGGRQPAPLAG